MEKVIRVYHDPAGKSSPWHVCVCEGAKTLDSYGYFRDPIAAINFALDSISAVLNLPVLWPESVVIA